MKRPSKLIQAPKGGWQENTWYLVEVSFSYDTLVHRAMFYSGQLTNTLYPGGSSYFADKEAIRTYADASYLKVLSIVASKPHMRMRKVYTPRMLEKEVV